MRISGIGKQYAPNLNLANRLTPSGQTPFSGKKAGCDTLILQNNVDDFFCRMNTCKKEAGTTVKQTKNMFAKAFAIGKTTDFQGQNIVRIDKKPYYVFYSNNESQSQIDFVASKEHLIVNFDKNTDGLPKKLNVRYEDENSKFYLNISPEKTVYGKEDKDTGKITILAKTKDGYMYEESSEDSSTSYARGYVKGLKKEYERHSSTSSLYGRREHTAKYTKKLLSSKWEIKK